MEDALADGTLAEERDRDEALLEHGRANAAPTAIGIPAPTIAFAPRFPVSLSAMCIEPERPLQ